MIGMDLSGQVAVVIGASGELGRVISRTLAKAASCPPGLPTSSIPRFPTPNSISPQIADMPPILNTLLRPPKGSNNG